MRKKISICCFLAVMLICIISVIIIATERFRTKELPDYTVGESSDNNLYADTDLSPVADTQTAEKEELAAASAVWQEPFVYMIKSRDGILVVYEKDENTVFFETDILLEELEPELQAKVTEGILFSDERELYGFLESHSS